RSGAASSSIPARTGSSHGSPRSSPGRSTRCWGTGPRGRTPRPVTASPPRASRSPLGRGPDFAMSPDLPRYVLITPARNEEAFIERTIQSVVRQTVLPVRWVIANDGSTDGTAGIARAYAARYDWIEVVDMPARRDRSFAAKAHCFNAGYERVRPLNYEVVG